MPRHADTPQEWSNPSVSSTRFAKKEIHVGILPSKVECLIASFGNQDLYLFYNPILQKIYDLSCTSKLAKSAASGAKRRAAWKQVEDEKAWSYGYSPLLYERSVIRVHSARSTPSNLELFERWPGGFW